MMKRRTKWLSCTLISATLLSVYPVSPTTAYENTEGLLDLSSPNDVSFGIDDCESFLKNVVLRKEGKLESYSSSQDILASIKSDEVFTMDGNIITNFGNYDITDYYDFSEVSKYEIANWAFENELISEEEKIDCYCDLVIQRNFDNIDCLTGIFYEIQRYSEENNISFELEAKVNKLLGANEYSPTYVPSNPYEGIYEGTKFRIHYDPLHISASIASDVNNYLLQVRDLFIAWGFNTPLLESSKYEVILDCNASSDGYAGVTMPVKYYNNVRTTYIIIYNFTSFTNSHKGTMVHEWFHAVQSAYNYDYNWFSEASATFASLIVQNNPRTEDKSINTFIKDFHTMSLSMLSERKGYGAALFPLTIYMDFGGMDTIRMIYEEYSKHEAKLDFQEFREVIDNGMLSNGYSGGFNNAYRKMACYILNVSDPEFGYGKVLPEASSCWTERKASNVITATTNSTATKTGSTNGLTSQYYKMEFPTDYRGKINIQVSSAYSSCYVETYYVKSGTPIIALNTKTSNSTNFQLRLGAGISEIIVVVSNLSDSSTISYTITATLSN